MDSYRSGMNGTKKDCQRMTSDLTQLNPQELSHNLWFN